MLLATAASAAAFCISIHFLSRPTLWPVEGIGKGDRCFAVGSFVPVSVITSATSSGVNERKACRLSSETVTFNRICSRSTLMLSSESFRMIVWMATIPAASGDFF